MTDEEKQKKFESFQRFENALQRVTEINRKAGVTKTFGELIQETRQYINRDNMRLVREIAESRAKGE